MTVEREPYKRNGCCVHCSQRNAIPSGECRYSTNGHGTMDLPEGKTCGDCIHLPRCQALLGRIRADESCDFFPMRFLEIET